MPRNAISVADKEEMTEDKVSHLSEKLANAVNAFKNDAGGKISEINEMVKEKSKEALDSSRDIISNKPVTAVAIAFGAGLLTALLLCRNKK
ncbi:MAG: hypothetical protein PHT71_09635 [Victivallaceae bacterium]|nr:hypothetical protein [Victivallaceae bacterium]